MKNPTTGNTGLVFAFVLSIAMCVVSFILGGSAGHLSSSGICFPSPDEWSLPTNLSFGLNLVIISGVVVGILILNKTYNFITTTDTVLQSSLLILICSNAFIDKGVNSSVLLGAVVVIIYFILFGCYRNKKSAPQLFIIGTLVSIAGLFQYAAIPYLLAVFFAAVVLKCMSFKGMVALGMGALTPYWILAGLGVIDLRELSMPVLSTVFTYDFIEEGYFLLWLNCGITALLFLSCSLYNAVSMYAGNTRRRLMNNSTLIFGLVSCLSIMFDIGNMVAYLTVLYLAWAVQLANLFALHNLKHGRAMVVSLLVLYVAAMVGMIYGI